MINASHKAERKINEQTGDITMTFEVKTDETSSTKLSRLPAGYPVFEAGALYRVEAKFFLYRSGQGFSLPASCSGRRTSCGTRSTRSASRSRKTPASRLGWFARSSSSTPPRSKGLADSKEPHAQRNP